MATQKITETLDEAQSWLSGASATVSMVAEGLLEDGGQAEANPKVVAAVLYGVLNQIRAAEQRVEAATVLCNKEGVDHGN